jgi:hypothetical protein
MTQPTSPLDLGAVETRYEAANRHTWPVLPGEEDNEFWDRVDADQKMAAAASLADVPALIAEIRRLQELLHPSNDTTANLLHAGWQRAREALRGEADGWATLGEWAGITLTYEGWEPSAQERVDEWSYEQDAHGYCHDRTDWIALLAEIERLRSLPRAPEPLHRPPGSDWARKSGPI